MTPEREIDVVDQSFTRRASYGPSSPTVGTRGARTRQQIVEAALECFATKGFHDSSVDDIAALAETSRATLYQYFESKDAIFVELMHESGGALHRATRRMQHLGPSASGYANLQDWLEDWAQVFDHYSAMFIEWANVNSPKAPLRPKLAQFVDTHTEQFVEELSAAGFTAGDPAAASILTLALTNRFNYIRHVYRPSINDVQLLESLTTALQLYLFPKTPAKVLAAGPHAGRRHEQRSDRPAPADAGPLATLPPRDSIPRPTPFEGRSPQASRTIRRLLDAAGTVFAASGYGAANVDQIVNEAGLARGTFYRYFSGKLDLITALADEAASAMCPLFDEFQAFADRPDRARLRAWLGRFLEAQQRYSGVMRAWTEGFPIDPVVLASAAEVVEALRTAVTITFGPPRPYPLDHRSMVIILASVLEHFPNEGAGSRHEPDHEAIIEAQALFIERVLVRR